MSLYQRLSDLTEAERTKILANVETVSDREAESSYQEMLNDIYGTVKIAGLDYETATALASVDPVAYRCGLADYCGQDDNWFVEYSGTYYVSDSLKDALDAHDDAQDQDDEEHSAERNWRAPDESDGNHD